MRSKQHLHIAERESKVHPAPNQIKCEGDQSDVSAVSAGDCLLSVRVWASKPGAAGITSITSQEGTLLPKGLTASSLIAFVTSEGMQLLG